MSSKLVSKKYERYLHRIDYSIDFEVLIMLDLMMIYDIHLLHQSSYPNRRHSFDESTPIIVEKLKAKKRNCMSTFFVQQSIYLIFNNCLP